jgi:hypothetical protein
VLLSAMVAHTEGLVCAARPVLASRVVITQILFFIAAFYAARCILVDLAGLRRYSFRRLGQRWV